MQSRLQSRRQATTNSTSILSELGVFTLTTYYDIALIKKQGVKKKRQVSSRFYFMRLDSYRFS